MLSLSPAFFPWLFSGIQSVPADVDAVPPTLSDFSTRSTSSPLSFAKIAAAMPAAPAPMIRRSTERAGGAPCRAVCSMLMIRRLPTGRCLPVLRRLARDHSKRHQFGQSVRHPPRGRITASRTTPERFPLEVQSVSPGPGAGRMDRPGRPRGDNDIVERYKNPNKELALPRGSRKASPVVVHEPLWPFALGLPH